MGTGVSPKRIATEILDYVVIECFSSPAARHEGKPSYTSTSMFQITNKFVSVDLASVHSILDNQIIKQPLLALLERR